MQTKTRLDPETMQRRGDSVHSAYITHTLPSNYRIFGNLASEWNQWKQMWISFEIVTNLRTRDNT